MVLKYTFSIVLALSLFSCNESANSSDQAHAHVDENRDLGKEDGLLIYTLNCVSCHGKDGKLGTSGAADLSKSKLDDKKAMKVIKEGNSKGMMPYKDMLEEEEIEALVEYIKTLRK